MKLNDVDIVALIVIGCSILIGLRVGMSLGKYQIKERLVNGTCQLINQEVYCK